MKLMIHQMLHYFQTINVFSKILIDLDGRLIIDLLIDLHITEIDNQ